MEWLGYPVQDSYKGLDISSLPLNHAWVIANTTIDNVSVYSVRDDCFNCPYKVERHLKRNQLESWQVEISHPSSWRILNQGRLDDTIKLHYKTGWLCQMRPTFKEYGVYHLDIGTCEVKPEVQPAQTYYPLLLFSVTLLAICALYSSICVLLKRRRDKNEVKEAQEKVLEINHDREDTTYIIDLYRGILLALIIFLTTGGGGYPIFINDFGGLTLAECVFFAYIWSIGVKIPSVIDKAFKEKTKWSTVRDIFIRSLLLTILGTAIDATVEDQHSKLRLWCPLQKIGLAYFIVATAYLLTVQRFEMKSKKLICKVLSNIVTLLWCWIIAAFVLAVLMILISSFASFNCLSNIRIQDIRAEDSSIIDEESQNCNNQMTTYVNRILVGEATRMINVNYYYGFSRGVLGIISAIIYMMIGLKSGVIYLNYRSHSDRLKLWFLWAVLFSIGGICFAVVSLPLNFNLWPISSIVFVASSAMFVFSLVYLASDVFRYTSFLLSSLGVTSLVILCGHMLFSNTLPFMWGIHFNNHLLYMVQNTWIVLLWLIVAVLLKKRNVHFNM